MSGNQIAKTTALLVPAQIVLRAGEGALPLLLAAWFGRTTATDVYYFSWAVFAFAGSLVFSAFQDSAIVPILAETKRKEPALVPIIRGSLFSYTTLFGSALSLVIGAVAAAYFRLKYGDAEFAVARDMVIPFCIYLVLLANKTLLFALLNAEKKFFYQPVCSAVGMLACLLAIFFLRKRFGVAAIPVGQLAGEAVSIASAFLVSRAHIPFRLNLQVPEPMWRFVRLIAAEVSGGAVTRVNPVVDQLMAGMANVQGGGTLLRYSNDVGSIPTSLLQATLLPVLLSHLSDDFADGHFARIRSTVRKSLLWVILAGFAIAGIFFVVRTPLLRLAFLHGSMDAQGVDTMASILPYHLIGVPAFGALLVLARAHVAVQNSRIMVSMGFLNAASNVVFNIIFLRVIGLPGLALSTSMVQAVVAIVFYIRFEKKLTELETSKKEA